MAFLPFERSFSFHNDMVSMILIVMFCCINSLSSVMKIMSYVSVQHIAVSFSESTSIAVSQSWARSSPLGSIRKTAPSIVLAVSESLVTTSTDLHLQDLLLEEALGRELSFRLESIFCFIEGSLLN